MRSNHGGCTINLMPHGNLDSPAVRFPPPLWYAIGLGIGFLLDRLLPIATLPRIIERRVGWTLVFSSLALAASALALFFRNHTGIRPHRPATSLVAVGPYRFTRNPMYVAMTLLYAGIAIRWSSIWSLILVPVVILVIDRLVIAREEAYLERRFGADYRQYKVRVRRWL